MAVRASMAWLITHVRKLINDPETEGGPTPNFTDDTLQYVLDDRQAWARYAPLRAERRILPGGLIEYHDYFADFGFWESDVQVLDRTYTPITPDVTNDLEIGYFEFTLNILPPVWIVGKYYDCYGAAADALERWATQFALDIDFKAQGMEYQRTQRITNLQNLAAMYRARSRPKIAVAWRDDANLDWPIPGPYWGL